MKFLSLYGSLNSKISVSDLLMNLSNYVPEDPCRIDPDIVREHQFALRLELVCSQYIPNQDLLKSVLPIISHNIGDFNVQNENLALWTPLNHLSFLGQLLIAGFLEKFSPENLQHPLYFVVDHEDSGIAFAKAFSIENKNIFFPNELINKLIFPEFDEKQRIIRFDQADKDNLQDILLKNRKIALDRSNFFCILGHMVTIVEALFCSESSRWRFYQDPVDLVLPANNLEFVLAAFYLKQAHFPIKTIHAVSFNHRMVHKFFQKGIFEITNLDMFSTLKISLDRILFEASRGSLDKIIHWNNMLKQTRMFKVDTKTLDCLKSAINPIFCNPNHFDNHLSSDEVRFSRLFPLLCQKIAEETSCKVIGMNLENPNLESGNATTVSFAEFFSNQ